MLLLRSHLQDRTAVYGAAVRILLLQPHPMRLLVPEKAPEDGKEHLEHRRAREQAVAPRRGVAASPRRQAAAERRHRDARLGHGDDLRGADARAVHRAQLPRPLRAAHRRAVRLGLRVHQEDVLLHLAHVRPGVDISQHCVDAEAVGESQAVADLLEEGGVRNCHAFPTPGVSWTGKTVFGRRCHCLLALVSGLGLVGTASSRRGKRASNGKKRGGNGRDTV